MFIKGVPKLGKCVAAMWNFGYIAAVFSIAGTLITVTYYLYKVMFSISHCKKSSLEKKCYYFAVRSEWNNEVFTSYFCKIILVPSHIPPFFGFLICLGGLFICFFEFCLFYLFYFAFDFYSSLSPKYKFVHLHDQGAFVSPRHLSTVKKMEKKGEEWVLKIAASMSVPFTFSF